MKSIEEIKAELKPQMQTLTFGYPDGSSESFVLYGNGRNAAHAFDALQAEATRYLLTTQLETATTPEEAAEVIRQVFAAQRRYSDKVVDMSPTSIDPLTQSELEEACAKHGLNYETLDEEADDTEYEPLA